MSEDAVSILQRAVQLTRERGQPCDGFMLQSASDGSFAAWLYVTDEGHQCSLFEEVEVMPTATEAAQWVLAHLVDD